MIKKSVQEYLLKLARYSIEGQMGIANKLVEHENSGILNEKRGVFVTLEMNGRLRGCIGNIMPIDTLENAVKENAINAAFNDPRFVPLSKEELTGVEIEISVLTVPKKLDYGSWEELLQKLRPNIDGVVLSKDSRKATYLPQVWEKVKDKKDFLCSLSQKAGLRSDAWKDQGVIIETYQVELFRER